MRSLSALKNALENRGRLLYERGMNGLEKCPPTRGLHRRIAEAAERRYRSMKRATLRKNLQSTREYREKIEHKDYLTIEDLDTIEKFVQHMNRIASLAAQEPDYCFYSDEAQETIDVFEKMLLYNYAYIYAYQ